jgi:hypothetical protein
VSTRALALVDDLLSRGGDADDVLRGVVRALAEEPGIVWAGILFLEQGALVPGPEAGRPDETRRLRVPIAYQGDPVGELAVDGEADAAVLAHVADAVSAHVLLGWDTGGEAWDP